MHPSHYIEATTYTSRLRLHLVNVDTPQEQQQQPVNTPLSYYAARTRKTSTDMLLLFTCCELIVAVDRFQVHTIQHTPTAADACGVPTYTSDMGAR
jgi:hypothetical protein